MIGSYSQIAKIFPDGEETMVEYWMSWSPMAPMFGYKYRFADFAMDLPGMTKSAAPAPVKPSEVKPTTAKAPAPAKKPVAAKKPAAPVIPKANGAATPKADGAAKAAPVAEKPAPKPAAPVAPEPAAEAAPKAAAAPAPVAEKKPAKVAKAKKDDLTKIKGIGPKLATLLNEHGVTQFSEIAAWSAKDVAKWDEKLGSMPGRIERDEWVSQAASLK